jgi:hypothetical protein
MSLPAKNLAVEIAEAAGDDGGANQESECPREIPLEGIW